MDKRREGGSEYHHFPSKISCLTVPKNSKGEPFSVSLISGIEKFYKRGTGQGGSFRGLCHDFLSKDFLSHSTETFRRGTFLCSVSENFR